MAIPVVQLPPDARPIPGYPGYFIAPDAQVYSTKRWNGGSLRRLKYIPRTTGYWAVRVYVNGRPATPDVHVLMALTFHGPKPGPKYQVRHLDGDQHNNRPENLAWGTVKDNIHDTIRMGRHPKGEASKNAKLTEARVRMLRATYDAGRSVGPLAREFGVCHAVALNAARRRSWRHVDDL